MTDRINHIAFYKVCATLLMLSVCPHLTNADDKTPIKLGVIVPLTGNGAEQGRWIERGLKMAQEDARARGEQAPELAIEDSQGQASAAVTAYRKLTTTDSVSAVITWGSGVALALAPLVNRDNVVQMGVATSSEDFSTPNDFNFRNYPKASQEAAYLAELASGPLKLSEIAIVHTENDYGTSTAEKFKNAFLQRGGKVLVTSQLQPGESDSRAQVLAVRKAKPQAIFLAAYPIEGGAFLKQARQQGITVPVIGSVALFASENALRTLGKPGDDLILAAAMPPLNPKSDFALHYQKLYGESFGPQHFYSVRAYDAYTALALAAASCGKELRSGACLREKLSNMKPFDGIGGPLHFDENGDIQPLFSAYRVKDGSYVALTDK